jgi:hypothetical protein
MRHHETDPANDPGAGNGGGRHKRDQLSRLESKPSRPTSRASHSHRLAFFGKPGRCTRTIQKRCPVGACITTHRSMRSTTLAPDLSKRATCHRSRCQCARDFRARRAVSAQAVHLVASPASDNCRGFPNGSGRLIARARQPRNAQPRPHHRYCNQSARHTAESDASFPRFSSIHE